MKSYTLASFTALGIFLLALTGLNSSADEQREGNTIKVNSSVKTEIATFAGGCFWCMEPPFEKLPGVKAVYSGYTGGKKVNPTYKEVARGRTDHREAIEVHYDPMRISYSDLLEVFWRNVDPTDNGGQFVDRGRQYRTGIFVHNDEQEQLAKASLKALKASGRFQKKIVTPIEKATQFYPAEEYHQDFYKKDSRHYKRYRRGSGRDQFIDKVWGKEKYFKPSKVAWKEEGYKRPSLREIKSSLTGLQYKVTQENGTERPYRNKYWDNKKPGIYVDIVSGEPLFSSKDKFKSGTGWPSFTRPLVAENIVEVRDSSYGMVRIEVRSKWADSHLGHLFKDGPKPTGLRYCINSASLRFIPVAELEKEGYSDFVALFKSPKAA